MNTILPFIGGFVLGVVIGGALSSLIYAYRTNNQWGRALVLLQEIADAVRQEQRQSNQRKESLDNIAKSITGLHLWLHNEFDILGDGFRDVVNAAFRDSPAMRKLQKLEEEQHRE